MPASIDCPSEQQIAAFVEGMLSSADRAGVERHLIRCDRCFELVGVLGALVTQPLPDVPPELRARVTRPSAVLVTRVLPAVAAAAVVILAVNVWRTPPRVSVRRTTPATSATASGDATERERASATDPILRLDEPKADSLIARGSNISWSGPPQAITYDIQVTTTTGDVLWSGQVDGGQHSLLVNGTLPAGQACYVWVDANLSDGRRLTSGVVKVRTAAEP